MKANGVDLFGSKLAVQLIKWISRALRRPKSTLHLKQTNWASSMALTNMKWADGEASLGRGREFCVVAFAI